MISRLGLPREDVHVASGDGVCALCADSLARGFVRRPLGRNDALVLVCAECDGGEIRAYDSTVGYRGGDGGIGNGRVGVLARALDRAIAKHQIPGLPDWVGQ